MKYFKYIALGIIATTVFSCKQSEPFIFSSKPSFELRDTIIAAPMGFIAEGSFKKDVVIYVLGNIPEKDITIKLGYSGSARSGIDYNMPNEIVYPKGAKNTVLTCEILKAADLHTSEDKELIVTILESDENVNGERSKVRIKIESGMPSQWVGYEGSEDIFDYYFTKCSKAKYQYFYKEFGFYDFKTVEGYHDDPWGKFATKLKAYKAVTNQRIDAENLILEAAGKDKLKDDDGSDLVF